MARHRSPQTARRQSKATASTQGAVRPQADGDGSTATQCSSWRATLLCASLIGAAAFVAYHNSLTGPFIFDDSYWIVENPTIRQLSPITDVLFSDRAISYGARPTVALTLAIDYAVGGTNVWPYHATKIVLHILTALALFGVVRRTLSLSAVSPRFGEKATILALCATLLWTVHPLQTAAVTYVIQRAEILVSLFYLLVLFCTIRGATAAVRPRASTLWYAGAAASAFLGAATKEVIVTAPLVALLYDRAFLSGSLRAAFAKRWGLYLSLVSSWAVIVWALIATRFHASSTGFVVSGFTSWTYLITQPSVIVHYMRMAIWPSGLALDYGWPPARGIGDVWLAGSLIIVLLGGTVWAVVRHPRLGFLPASFFLILAPTSSFIPILDACFDHRMYLALAAPIIAVVLAGNSIIERWRGNRSGVNGAAKWTVKWAPPAAFALVFVALCTSTIVRNDDFRSEESIWRDAVAKRPDNARAHNGLGDALKDQGQDEPAIAEYEQAIELKPELVESYQSLLDLLKKHNDLQRGLHEIQRLALARPNAPAVYNNLAGFLAADGKIDEALETYKKSLGIDPANVDTRLRLADFLVSQARLAEATGQYEAILKIAPDFAEARSDYSHALALQGKLDEAIGQAKLALELKPGDAAAHFRLADALGRQGRIDDAFRHYSRAIEIAPGSARMHHDFGYFLAQHNRAREASIQFYESVSLEPDSPEAHNNLAAVLILLGRRQEAIAQCRVALKLNPRYPEAENNLGELLAQRGDLDEAASHFRTALELRPDYPEAKKNLESLLERRKGRGANSTK